MPRLACLYVADFSLAALQRLEPDLRGRPVAAAEAEGERAPVVAFSKEAARLGMRDGLSAAQARSLSESLVVRRVTPEALRSAEAALLDVADAFSPRVESAGAGTIFLDIDGLTALFGSEGHLATSLAARTRRVGLEARVAVASSKLTASLLARASEGVTVSPPEEERPALAPLPVALLEPSSDLALTFERFGIRTLGDLARLPGEAVATRLGPEALRAWRTARGEDGEPLAARPRPLSFEESVDCEYGIASFEPLSFLLRAALERLVARLEVRGLRAGDLGLSLRLESGEREERTVGVAAPTKDARALLALVRLSFERRPPRGAVEWFRLSPVPERLRPIELGLFVPSGPSAEDLDLAINRLAALAGPERVGRPAAVDSHAPAAFALEPFSLPAAAEVSAERSGVSALALRALRPPSRIQVACDRGRPDFVSSGEGAKLGGRVVTLAGPWRLSGEWWRDAPLARDYYDAELSDGCVYRIYCDHRSGEWFADGIYD